MCAWRRLTPVSCTRIWQSSDRPTNVDDPRRYTEPASDPLTIVNVPLSQTGIAEARTSSVLGSEVESLTTGIVALTAKDSLIVSGAQRRFSVACLATSIELDCLPFPFRRFCILVGVTPTLARLPGQACCPFARDSRQLPAKVEQM